MKTGSIYLCEWGHVVQQSINGYYCEYDFTVKPCPRCGCIQIHHFTLIQFKDWIQSGLLTFQYTDEAGYEVYDTRFLINNEDIDPLPLGSNKIESYHPPIFDFAPVNYGTHDGGEGEKPKGSLHVTKGNFDETRNSRRKKNSSSHYQGKS